LKNFIDLYFSDTKNPAIQLIKQIPIEQIKYILSLDGFKSAKQEVDNISNYLVNMHDDGEEKAEVQSTVSSKSFSIANSIFKENKLTYDTFLGLLSDPTKDDTKQTHAKP
jgi:hypothetical protein